MRRLAAVLLASVLTSSAKAQVFGTYTITTPQGGVITLVLKQAAGGVGGSMSGNGSSYTVQGQLQGADGARGSLKTPGGNVFFEAMRAGSQLTLILADPGPNGQPDYAKAQELHFTRQDDGAAPAQRSSAGESVTRSLGASPSATSAPNAQAEKSAAPNSAPRGSTPQDQQLIQLILSSPWCSYHYSGGKTYTGGTAGSEHTTRTVFGSDGTVVETSGGEITSTGAPGAVWGNSAGRKQGRWKVQGGALWLSADGVQWVPQPMTVSRNSNGYPIVKTGNTEYFQCR